MLILTIWYFSLRMKDFYTVKEAAEVVGVSGSRIRQLALAGQIEHQYFGKMVMITKKGITQAKARNTKLGRPFTKTHRRKAA